MKGEGIMSNGGGSSGLQSSNGSKEHARPTSGHIGHEEMFEGEKVDWIKKVLDVDDKEAQRILTQIENYLNEDDYKDIHSGKRKIAESMIDKLLNGSKVPIFNGETFRGVYIRPDGGRSPDSIVQEILKSGRWREPGITSFSSSRSVANDFADPLLGKGNGVGVVIRNVRNRTGVPVAHLSGHYNEMEVMHPSSIRNSGFKILDWEKRGNTYHVTVTE